MSGGLKKQIKVLALAALEQAKGRKLSTEAEGWAVRLRSFAK